LIIFLNVIQTIMLCLSYVYDVELNWGIIDAKAPIIPQEGHQPLLGNSNTAQAALP